MTVCGRCAGRDGGERTQQKTLADRAGASWRGRSVVRWVAQAPTVPSGWEWQGAQPCQGAAELDFPGPALWQMQGEAARRAGEPSRQTEEPPPEGLGGHDLLTQTNPRRPAGQVVGHHLYRQPSAVGGETAGRHVVQPDAVLEVAYGVLDLGVAAMVSLQFQGLSVPVGDEAVIAVGGEEGQLGTGRGLHPPDDEPHRHGAGLALEGSVGGLGHIGGAVHPVGNGSPGIFRYGLDDIVQAFVLPDGDGEADIHLAADGYHAMSVEAAVGPHRELPLGPGVAYPAHRLPQEVSGAPGGVGAALAQPGHQHVPGSGGDGQQWVIAPLAGVAVVAGALLGQTVGLADGRIELSNVWQSTFVIPAYLQEEYPDPDLDHVDDLKDPKFQELFSTGDSRGKARVVACVPGWPCELVNDAQIEGYGLTDYLYVIKPGSQDAMFSVVYVAYEKQEPWLGYMWGTADPALLLDLVLLEETPYSDECWFTTKACAFEDGSILIAVHPSLLSRAPDVIEFLRNWDFNVSRIYQGIFRWMVANNATPEMAAINWLKNNPRIWGNGSLQLQKTEFFVLSMTVK